jgi:hypothetical protein
MSEFDDIVVTEADLEAAAAASPTKKSSIVSEAARMPSGHAQQAVDVLHQRIAALGDAFNIQKATERSRRRKEVAEQLKLTIKSLDRVYKQNFQPGHKVLMKYKVKGTCTLCAGVVHV